MLLEPLQCTLADGVKLSEVTFVVVDLETTGGSPTDHAITEVGAVTYRGGERLSTFQTLVDPRQPIPPFVAHLTGIDDLTVAGAPEIHHILPSFLEFARGSIFVGHNASFDFGFLNANLLRRWVLDAEQTRTTSAKVESSVRDAAGQAGALASFVPVGLDPTPSPPDIRIELNRNATLVTVTWPSGAAAECGAWLREVLR